MNRKIQIILLIAAAVAVAGLLAWDAPRSRVEMLLEKSAIEQAAENYLKAETQGNYKQVYALLAPSSVYRKTHSYEEFLKDMVNDPPVKIGTYQIVSIYRLRANDNRANYPGVDKLVQVEVDITFANSGANSVFNYSFTFLKEKGYWYKG